MWRTRACRCPDEAKFTSYGRLEAIVLLAVALAMCVGAGILLGDGWPSRSASPAAWLGRRVVLVTIGLMCVVAALMYANLARPRLSYWRQVVTTDSSALTLTQDGLQKVVPWEEVQEFRVDAFQHLLVGAGERLLISAGGPALRATVQQHLPTGARFTRVPMWYEWLGIEAPASAEHSIIWPNQAIFKHSPAMIAAYLGVGLALLVCAAVWVQRIVSWAAVGPEFISDVAPALAVTAVLTAFYAILALVLVWGGRILLRHRREAVQTDDHGISMIRGDDRSTISWPEVRRFEVTRYHYRIVAADRAIAIAVPPLFGNPDLRRIIERNLLPTATYRHRRGWWRAPFGNR